jgi:hypothetical protein
MAIRTVPFSQVAAEPGPAADSEFTAAEKLVAEENAKRSGIGTRMKVGRTRGKGSIVIKYEQFDDAQPETLPKSIESFLSTVNLDPEKNEADIVRLLVAGYNEESYTAASDPLSEHVESIWPQEVQTQFRTVARNYSRGANVPLEEAVALIKPGFVKQFGPKPATA